MCGICGIVEQQGHAVAPRALTAMVRALAHRGPDGQGQYIDGHVGLGHTRLSIIDLGGGVQPMFNEDRSVVVVFNGEIFNYRELTAELVARGHVFETHSDTETLVHLFEEHGMNMLQKLRGMFAFALLDRRTDTTYLVRDRFGIKPLYYHQTQGRLLFASEIAPLMAGGYSVEINRASVHQYLQTRFAHGDETMFQGVFRLPEGTYLSWRRGAIRQHRYYASPVIAPDSGVSDDDFQQQFDAAFENAVQAWMVADVPVGAYLSGGVDSSMIVSQMTRLTSHPVRTFCVDFDRGHSEAAAAEQTARALGCEHTTVRCGIEQLLELPSVVRSLEEPVGDGIVVAQYLLSRATRASGIKTVLTGDGADETLGGYQHLRAISTILALRERLPVPALWTTGAWIASRLPLTLVESLAGLPLGVAADARDRLASVLRQPGSPDPRILFDEFVALFRPSELRDVYTAEYFAEVGHLARETFAGDPAGTSVLGRVLSMQYRRWLPANINMKQDRLCMAHGIENRVPFLDHNFVELMNRAPDRVKIAGRTSKVALRRLAKCRLPASVAAAPKVPFHLPLQHYMQDSRLQEFMDEYLDETRIRRRGFVRPEYVRSLRQQANRGGYMPTKKLFALVILEIWHRVFIDREQP